MKRDILVLSITMYLLSLSTWGFANGAVSIDKKGVKVELTDVKVELTDVETKEIEFEFGRFCLPIPVNMISTLRLSEDGETLFLKLITGSEESVGLKADSVPVLKGTWDLGEYSIALSNIKLFDAGRSAEPSESTAEQPDGFYAIITDQSGRTMELADFRYRIQYFYSSGYINVPSGHEYEYRRYLPVEYKEVITGIPFANIESVKFTEKEPEKKGTAWEPQVFIKLSDGSTMTAKLMKFGEYAWKFTGVMQRGDPIKTVDQIIFDHKRDKNTPATSGSEASADVVFPLLNSEYTISVRTWQGNQIRFINGCSFGVYKGYRWYSSLGKDELRIRIGDSTNTVGFDKIKKVQFQEKGKREIELTTVSGKIIQALLMSDKDNWLGGKLESFEPGRIKMDAVASFEISKMAEQ